MIQSKLSEKDFIHEGYSKDPYSLWLWLCILMTISVIFWGVGTWVSHVMSDEFQSNPFLQVTNRQFSIFLWQYPEHMRINAKRKNGYLTGFDYIHRVGLRKEAADDYVEAPPEVLFLYHTWDRLISKESPQRSVPADEFREFLSDAQEWQPEYWKEAPKDYMKLIRGIPAGRDLSAVLPLEVRQAFQGWKNYFKEGDAINQIKPTYGEMEQFLEKYPHYARNYWKNILTDKYLRDLSEGDFDPNSEIPQEEMAPFLKVAFFNFQQMYTQS